MALFNIITTYSNRILKSKLSSKANYSRTLHFPQTTFPLSQADLPQTEQTIHKICQFDDLYTWQSKLGEREPFVLHDGPPYANGDVHIGHALNKVLKDITNRYKLLRGHRVHYIPGWDCHGLPIEWKIKECWPDSRETLSSIAIRSKARELAEGVIGEQKKAFMRWGVMADWSRPYKTMDFSYQADQIRAFRLLFDKGLLYRRMMPVYWSPTTKTALAESELEYTQHVSQSVYLRCLLPTPPVESSGLPVYAVVWTTTPWTLPSNEAICYNSNINYGLYYCHNQRAYYIMSVALAQSVAEHACLSLQLIRTGVQLGGCTYRHPFGGHRSMIHSTHVTDDEGTALVHCAPSHGHDDYIIGLNNDLLMNDHVDDDGRFRNVFGLGGLDVLTDIDEVIRRMGDDVIAVRPVDHSYPYDWRSKTPVIQKPSFQWFFDCARIRDRALEFIDKLEVVPRSMAKEFRNLVERRPVWCISRQRAWGVPIPVFYNTESGEPVVERAIMTHVEELFRKEGADVWWTGKLSTLLPPEVDHSKLRRGEDIMDIWMDSGLSWMHVLADGRADVYLEGVDQIRGWFQSSLLTSVALQTRAPFDRLLIHGFARDQKGMKMSKSVGNVVSPWDITEHVGSTTLRWWVSSTSFHGEATCSSAIFHDCYERVFHIRKFIRFMLGCIHDFDGNRPSDRLWPVDEYFIHHINTWNTAITSAYDSYKYSTVLQLLEDYSRYASTNHLALQKHRLYCFKADSEQRRSAQFCVNYCLDLFMAALAPIVPHLIEEAYLHHPMKSATSFFKHVWPSFNIPIDLSLIRKMDALQDIKRVLSERVPDLSRVNVHIHDSSFADLAIAVDGATYSPLAEFLQCCSVDTGSNVANGPTFLNIADIGVSYEKSVNVKCDRCRRFAVIPNSPSHLCLHCHNITC